MKFSVYIFKFEDIVGLW